MIIRRISSNATKIKINMFKVGREGSDEWLTNAISRIDRIFLKLVVTNIDLIQMKFLYWIYNLAHLLFDVNDALDSDISGHVSLSILVIGQHFNSPPLRPVLSPPWSAIRTRKPHTAKQLLQNLYSPHCPLYYEIKGCCQNNCAIIHPLSSSHSLMKFWDQIKLPVFSSYQFNVIGANSF